MNFCKDCAHAQPDGYTLLCARTKRLDYVTGEMSHYLCRVERQFDTETGCGPTGKFFEAKAKEAA